MALELLWKENLEEWFYIISSPFYFFISYLDAPRPTLGHWRGGNLTHSMLIIALYLIHPEGHQEPLV